MGGGSAVWGPYCMDHIEAGNAYSLWFIQWYFFFTSWLLLAYIEGIR